ncbi:hypothetical protein [Agrobacterium pusense]|uniref:hypothetical protein n=1 Tax=Agrobacterium pusense TaxID=648995 RepID=UPI002FE2D272
MTEGEILDLFIRAAEIDHRLPNAPKPAELKAQSLPFIHSAAEKGGWIPADFNEKWEVVSRKDHLGNDVPLSEAQRRVMKKQLNDRLEYGDTGRLELQARQFWSSERITPSQVTELEQALELMRLVSRSRNRRCLWAYAKSRSKVLFEEADASVTITPDDGKKRGSSYSYTGRTRRRMSFSKWCVEVEDIHRNYGKTCADHAIAEIALKAFGNTLFPNENVGKRTLQNGQDFGHIPATMDNSASDSRMTVSGWCVRDTNKALRKFDSEIIHVPLTDLRNARRRQREARKREAA